MTVDEAVRALNALKGRDPETGQYIPKTETKEEASRKSRPRLRQK
mgnify:CR=1 FL=1